MKLSSGTTHALPTDMRNTIIADKIHEYWQNITPLARNEWICWITSAKKSETRAGRIVRMVENLQKGKRRPCCWAGCPHR